MSWGSFLIGFLVGIIATAVSAIVWTYLMVKGDR